VHIELCHDLILPDVIQNGFLCLLLGHELNSFFIIALLDQDIAFEKVKFAYFVRLEQSTFFIYLSNDVFENLMSCLIVLGEVERHEINDPVGDDT